MKTRPARILLVEDDKDHIDIIRAAFESYKNFLLDTACSLRKAREFIKKTEYDLIIADLFLPDGEGTSLLKNPDRKNSFPVIIMTGHGDESRAVSAIKAGALDYIIKTDKSITELPQIIERSLREWDHIIELEKAEEKIRQSEEKSRTLQENLPIGLFRSTSKGNIIYANSTIVRFFGYESSEEFMNMNAVDLYSDHNSRKEMFNKIKTEGSVQNYESKMKKKDGTLFWGATNINAVFDKKGELTYLDGSFIDITERKKAEEALKKSEALYSALFHHNPVQTVVVDKKGKIIAFNKAKESSGDRLPEIGEIMYKDYACHHKNNMHKELMECISSGQMLEFPEQVYNNKVLSIKISPFEQGAIITSQDITFQKRAEEELKKSEEKIRLITDNMLDIVSMSDKEGKLNFVSKSHTQVLGYTMDELMEKTMYNSVHPDDLGYVEEHYKNLISGPAFLTYRIKHKDGHYLWLESYCRGIFNSNREYIGAVVSSRDITSRKFAEEKIEHLNELLFAIRNINQLIAYEKKSARLIQGVCDCLLQSRGHRNIWIALTDASNNIIAASESGLETKMLPILKTRKNITSLNCYNLINHSGPAVINDLSICGDCRFSDGDSNVGRVIVKLEYNNKIYGVMNVGVFREFISEEQEISLLKEVSEDIAFGLYNIELEEEKKELQKQLYKSARLSAVGQLAAGIAHEFNNLLSVILGHTQLSLEEDSVDEIKKSLKEIEKTVKRGGGIVIKLAAFAKPKEPDFKTQEISKVIDDVLLLQKRQLQLESIKIETKYEAKSKISFDRGQMEQVFLNLLINSIHAIKPKARGKIIITAKDTEKFIEIRFSDNGIGMDKDIKSKVFDPFFTTKGAWATDDLGISGTGLGLSIAHSIIKQHNGTISVKSQKNKGTTFIIRLPVAVSGQIAEERPVYNIPEKDIEKIKDMRILLVDDEEEMVELFKQLFRKAGFENIKIENTGEKAVSVFSEFKPDIVFLDLIMPEMGGERIFKEIKTINKKTPVVFMSGKVDSEKDIYLKNGVFDYIQKPFSINEIYSILNRVARNGH